MQSMLFWMLLSCPETGDGLSAPLVSVIAKPTRPLTAAGKPPWGFVMFAPVMSPANTSSP